MQFLTQDEIIEWVTTSADHHKFLFEKLKSELSVDFIEKNCFDLFAKREKSG